MKKIPVNGWNEEGFILKVAGTRPAETVRARIGLAMRALAQHEIQAANRAVRKTLRAAELALWQATGGDFLRAS